MVLPIVGLDELWNWDLESSKPVDVKPLRNYRHKLNQGLPETMICHDMKGGYLDEESDNGIILTADIPNPYVFLNWWNIDIFCYFSHNFVTIPPIAYINVAHTHGCLALGTFITEWIEGKKLCEKILESEENVKRTVECLVSIANHYHFDGWLVNIENEIQEENLENLKLFLELLTSQTRASTDFSRVIWYDSVTASGNLKWQNMLNEHNLAWYSSCDGIYLNYNWDDEMLLRSADFGALNRIFVGIDCFARGCIGGWDCYRSFAKANLIRMSIALFAPGWICERFPNHANPIELGLRFWNKLTLYAPARPIIDLPISTNFCAGFTRESGTTRFRLNSMSLQPQYGLSSSQPVPSLCDGLILAKGSCTRLFNFDVKCESCHVSIKAERAIRIILNDIVRKVNRTGDVYSVRVDEPIHLRSLDVLVDDEKECLIYYLSVEEI
ncbi:hypothetical protein Q1695_015216 [Nippostrongylus brasiliensis]|nr:hypothetical protein Q1695_015216 [Nippostrongylus brasiliensis]